MSLWQYADIQKKREEYQNFLNATLGWKVDKDFLLAYDSGHGPSGVLNGQNAQFGGVWKTTGLVHRRNNYFNFDVNITGYEAAVIDVGEANVLVEIDLLSTHSTRERSLGIVTNYVDDENWLLISVYGDSVFYERVLIGKVKDGVYTTLKSYTTDYTYYSPLRLSAKVIEGELQAMINGVVVTTFDLSEEDWNYYKQGTSHGFGTHLMARHYNNFLSNLAIYRTEWEATR